MKEVKIRFRVSLPDYSNILYLQYDWLKSIYGDTKKALPYAAQIALVNHVSMTCYVDANLYHDMLTRRSVTGVLYFLNKPLLIGFRRNKLLLKQIHIVLNS